MDEQVLAAMEKWPNVPAAYGWLSLNARGLWRFHHQGDFAADPDGDTIENKQLIEFFNRNYCVNDKGEWYVQNGPQKAYVNLPHAPFILFYDDIQQQIKTHHGHTINSVEHWYLSEDGRVFAKTDSGPSMLIDRDLPAFLDNAVVFSIASDHADKAAKKFDEHDVELLASGQSLSLSLAGLSATCGYIEKNKAEEILDFISQPKA